MISTSDDPAFHDFLDFSSVATGFSRYRVLGTGETEEFYEALGRILGPDLRAEFLTAVRDVLAEAGPDEARREARLEAKIFGDQKLGPIARNLVKLWYVGVWYRLPDAWHLRFHTLGEDRDQVFSTAAYTEALLWPAIGANPPGAKGPGYGTWAHAPEFPEY